MDGVEDVLAAIRECESRLSQQLDELSERIDTMDRSITAQVRTLASSLLGPEELDEQGLPRVDTAVAPAKKALG